MYSTTALLVCFGDLFNSKKHEFETYTNEQPSSTSVLLYMYLTVNVHLLTIKSRNMAPGDKDTKQLERKSWGMQIIL